MIRLSLVVLFALLLASCATRGALDIACNQMRAVPLPNSQLVDDIQSGARTIDVRNIGRAAALRPLAPDASMRGTPATELLSAQTLALGEMRRQLASGPTLLLSGGGQWGAFGAGYLAMLNERGQLPHFNTVTGVSTGALQAIFMGAIGDPALGSDEQRRDLFRSLMGRYRPASEKEIVNRDPSKLFAVATGSFAGVRPLERRVKLALCDREVDPVDCPLIRHLAQSTTHVYVGFVRADDGHFYIADITALARDAYPGGSAPPAPPAMRAESQRCITGAAIASSAMPVFYQQIRVGPPQQEKTLYDGGVRQSVFEAALASLVDAAGAGGPSSMPSDIYVVRNGPTGVVGDEKANRKSDALGPAMRAEAIVVNQLEVQSIADLRLAHPRGNIFLMTADGYDREHAQPGDDPGLAGKPFYKDASAGPEVCVKDPPEAMFSPSFMACVMRYGRLMARDVGWRNLSELQIDQPAVRR